MLSKKELRELAKKIAQAEQIIIENKNAKAVKVARQYIENTTSSLALTDIFELDVMIQEELNK